MAKAMSQSHKTDSSIAFFINPFLRLVNVTWRFLSSLMRSMRIFSVPSRRPRRAARRFVKKRGGCPQNSQKVVPKTKPFWLWVRSFFGLPFSRSRGRPPRFWSSPTPSVGASLTFPPFGSFRSRRGRPSRSSWLWWHSALSSLTFLDFFYPGRRLASSYFLPPGRHKKYEKGEKKQKTKKDFFSPLPRLSWLGEREVGTGTARKTTKREDAALERVVLKGRGEAHRGQGAGTRAFREEEAE